MGKTKSEAIETLKNDIEYHKQLIEAIDAIIPVMRKFNGKKPYKNTFNPAIESAYKGLECGFYGRYGLCITLRTDFEHSDYRWPEVLYNIDWQNPIDAKGLIARLNGKKEFTTKCLNAEKEILERIDDIMDMWNSAVSQIVELREIARPCLDIYKHIGISNLAFYEEDLIAD